MRDLATYETNYACDIDFRTHVLKYYKYVNEIKQKLERISETSNNESHWLDEKFGNMIHDKIEKLQGEELSKAYLKY
jgi:hypothetical protein